MSIFNTFPLPIGLNANTRDTNDPPKNWFQKLLTGLMVGLDVPSINSDKDDSIADVIGNKEDNSFSRYNPATSNFHPSIIGHLRAAYYHAHGESFSLPANAPITLAPGAEAYVYGDPVSIGTYATSVFDVHWVSVTDIGDNGYYNVQLCNSDATVIYGKTFVSRTANFTQEGNVPIQVPPLPKGTEVFARVGSSTGNAAHTVKIKLFCHPYNDRTE
jgi:hypothetical protein